MAKIISYDNSYIAFNATTFNNHEAKDTTIDFVNWKTKQVVKKKPSDFNSFINCNLLNFKRCNIDSISVFSFNCDFKESEFLEAIKDAELKFNIKRLVGQHGGFSRFYSNPEIYWLLNHLKSKGSAVVMSTLTKNGELASLDDITQLFSLFKIVNKKFKKRVPKVIYDELELMDEYDEIRNYILSLKNSTIKEKIDAELAKVEKPEKIQSQVKYKSVNSVNSLIATNLNFKFTNDNVVVKKKESTYVALNNSDKCKRLLCDLSYVSIDGMQWYEVEAFYNLVKIISGIDLPAYLFSRYGKYILV